MRLGFLASCGAGAAALAAQWPIFALLGAVAFVCVFDEEVARLAASIAMRLSDPPI